MDEWSGRWTGADHRPWRTISILFLRLPTDDPNRHTSQSDIDHKRCRRMDEETTQGGGRRGGREGGWRLNGQRFRISNPARLCSAPLCAM